MTAIAHVQGEEAVAAIAAGSRIVRLTTPIEKAMASPNVLVLNEENFESEVLQSAVPVLVDFTATWCGPCKALAPIVEKIADDYQGKVKVGKLDIDLARETTKKYGVRSVPTVIVFQGGENAGQSIGLTTREKLIELLGI